jgi:hypothetical protein
MPGIKSTSIVALIAFLAVSSAKSQVADKAKIIGTWTVISHSLTAADTAMQLKFAPYSNRTYIFNSDGTFILKFYGKASGMAMLGRWKLNQTNKSIGFSHMKVQIASPPPFTTDNQSIQFIQFTDSAFTIKEYLEGDIKPGLSIYKKVL